MKKLFISLALLMTICGQAAVVQADEDKHDRGRDKNEEGEKDKGKRQEPTIIIRPTPVPTVSIVVEREPSPPQPEYSSDAFRVAMFVLAGGSLIPLYFLGRRWFG